jgi:anti-anti-sigma regulatory factor
MKIEKAAHHGKITVRLIGHFQAEHVGELSKHLQDDGTPVVLDLLEVTIVDVEVVRFLGTCEANGVKIVNCPQYIREWMNRERDA